MASGNTVNKPPAGGPSEVRPYGLEVWRHAPVPRTQSLTDYILYEQPGRNVRYSLPGWQPGPETSEEMARAPSFMWTAIRSLEVAGCIPRGTANTARAKRYTAEEYAAFLRGDSSPFSKALFPHTDPEMYLRRPGDKPDPAREKNRWIGMVTFSSFGLWEVTTEEGVKEYFTCEPGTFIKAHPSLTHRFIGPLIVSPEIDEIRAGLFLGSDHTMVWTGEDSLFTNLTPPPQEYRPLTAA